MSIIKNLAYLCRQSTNPARNPVQKLQECNDASLNFNSIRVFLLTLYCVLSHDLFSVDQWE